MTYKLNVLKKIATKFNKEGIVWAVGSSTMLFFNQIVDHFNDIDILIAEKDITLAKAILDDLGTLLPSKPTDSYHTKHFYEYTVDGIDIDIISGYIIVNNNASHFFPLEDEPIEYYRLDDQIDIPLMTIDTWHSYYQLMNRTDKVELLNRFRGLDQTKFDEFITIAKQLNQLNITPVLTGLVGMEFVTHRSWQPSNISIYVPEDAQNKQAPIYRHIERAMIKLGYMQNQSREGEMVKGNLSIKFDILNENAAISTDKLITISYQNAVFKVPSLKDLSSEIKERQAQ